MVKRLLVSLLALSVAGCGGRFPPETLVDSLRVLAITAEPPEVAPGESSRLSVLFASPTVGTRTVLWVGCEPDPQDLGRSACNDAALLLKPTTITDYPPGLSLLGFGPSSSYASTSTLFDVLEPQNPIRQSGTVGQVLSLVVGEEVDPLATGEKLRGYFERIEKKETEAVVALTRVLVSEKAAASRNHNPRLPALSVDGAPLPTGAKLLFKAGQSLTLKSVAGSDSAETYLEQQPSGAVERHETVVGAWYSTHGRFSRERFDLLVDDETTYVAPGSSTYPDDVVPERRTGVVWLVARDNRGGQAFASYPFFVCDEALPAPKVTGVSVDGTDLVVQGENLTSLADIVVGGAALLNAGFRQDKQAFVGALPPLPSGHYEVTARTRRCETVATGQSFDVP